MPEIDHQLIDRLGERVELVEKRISQLERCYPVINVPSLNELRYALVHLLRYLRDAPDPLQNAQNAIKHAKRAHYDCFEAEALYFFKEFAQFEDTFKNICLIEHISDYLDWSAHFEHLRDFMQNTSREDRDQYCDDLELKLVNLRPIHTKLKAARVELLKYVQGLEHENKKLEEDNAIKSDELKVAHETLKIRRKHLCIAYIVAAIAFAGLFIQLFNGESNLSQPTTTQNKSSSR